MWCVGAEREFGSETWGLSTGVGAGWVAGRTPVLGPGRGSELSARADAWCFGRGATALLTWRIEQLGRWPTGQAAARGHRGQGQVVVRRAHAWLRMSRCPLGPLVPHVRRAVQPGLREAYLGSSTGWGASEP